MIRRCYWAGLGLLLAVPALAQEPLSEQDRPQILGRVIGVRFAIVGGQLTADTSNVSDMSSWASSPSRQRTERIDVDGSPDHTRLRYELTTQRQQFRLEISPEGAIRLQRRRFMPEREVTLDVDPARPLAVSVREGDVVRARSGSSLWHVLLTAPATDRQEIIELVELLQPAWRLDDTCREIQQELIRRVRQGSSGQRAQWLEWVDQLSSDRFRDRELATRRLEAAGLRAAPLLRSRDPAQLSPEQRQRIAAILSRISEQREDTPVYVALWLLEDRAVWLALLEDPDVGVRRAALVQLQELTGQPLVFDPAADAAARARQLELLRGQLSGQP